MDPRSDQALILHTHLTTIQLPSHVEAEDSWDWFVEDVKCQGFSSSRTWEAFMSREEEKQWSESIWFKGAVPKHAFNMWVSHLNRLPTRKILAAWGLITSTECCLCSTSLETIDHLFLTCEFDVGIRRQVFSRFSPTQHLFSSWSELFSWTRTSTSGGPRLLRKTVAQEVVFIYGSNGTICCITISSFRR